MIVKTSRITTCLAVAIATTMAGAASAQSTGFSTEVASIDDAPSMKTLSSDKLPPASPNACYARVSVPAVYKTEKVASEIRPQLSRFKITPPSFKGATEKVTIYPETTSIKPIQPVIEKTKQKLEVFPSSIKWVRGSLKSDQPLTEGEMVDIKETGVDMSKVEAGNCLYEHYQAASVEKVPTKVLISEATEKLSVENAKLANSTVDVTIKPGHQRMIEVPPTFKKGEAKIMTENAMQKWQTKCGAVERVDHMTGETLCLVDVAAKFKIGV